MEINREAYQHRNTDIEKTLFHNNNIPKPEKFGVKKIKANQLIRIMNCPIKQVLKKTINIIIMAEINKYLIIEVLS